MSLAWIAGKLPNEDIESELSSDEDSESGDDKSIEDRFGDKRGLLTVDPKREKIGQSQEIILHPDEDVESGFNSSESDNDSDDEGAKEEEVERALQVTTQERDATDQSQDDTPQEPDESTQRRAKFSNGSGNKPSRQTKDGNVTFSAVFKSVMTSDEECSSSRSNNNWDERQESDTNSQVGERAEQPEDFAEIPKKRKKRENKLQRKGSNEEAMESLHDVLEKEHSKAHHERKKKKKEKRSRKSHKV